LFFKSGTRWRPRTGREARPNYKYAHQRRCTWLKLDSGREFFATIIIIIVVVVVAIIIIAISTRIGCRKSCQSARPNSTAGPKVTSGVAS
jgi:hypothetical protein